MLWLALEFPRLPLQALASPSSPSAVVERGRVRVADAQAAAAGVLPGQRLATALALAPGLQALAGDPGCEAAALQQLAAGESKYLPQLARVAMDACKQCEDECKKTDKHPECKACGEACAACYKECKAIAV